MNPLVLIGLLFGAAVSAMIVLFIGGEILGDPGGTQGALLVGAWLVAPVILAVLAIVAPRVAYPILVAVVALVIAAGVASIPLAQTVWDFEDTHGPLSLMVLLAALMPLIALGRHMPSRAGWLMVILMGATVALQAVSLGIVGEWSVLLVFGVLMPPFIIVAVLYVVGGKGAST